MKILWTEAKYVEITESTNKNLAFVENQMH